MMGRRTSTRVLNGLGILALMLVGGLTYQRTVTLIAQNREITRSHEAIRAINDILTNLQYAETGQRGYLLTGDPLYLQPYDRGTADVARAVDHLADIMADDGVQRGHLQQLDDTTSAKLAELRETIRLRRDMGLEAALRVVETDEGQQLMDTVRSLTEAMTTREQALLSERLEAANRESRRTLATMVTGILLTAILFLSSGILFSLDLLRSRRETSALASALDLLNPILAAHPTQTAVIAPDGRVVSSNISPTCRNGGERRDIVALPFQHVVCDLTGQEEAAVQPIFGDVEKVLQGQSNEILRRISASGDAAGRKHFALRAKPVVAQGERHVLLCFTDETESTTALETARLNEAMFRLAMNNAPIGMALVSPEGKWLRVNRAVCALTGYTEAELLEIDFQTITHPDDLGGDMALVEAMLRKEVEHYELEKRYIRKSGEPVWIQLSVSLVWDAEDQPQFFIAQIQDIHDRKMTERTMRLNKERLELALLGGELGTWDWRVDEGFVHYDRRWAEMLGYTTEELAPDMSTWERLVHPGDRPAVLTALQAHIRSETDVYAVEHRLRHKDGHWVWVLTKGKVIECDAAGEPLRICGTHLDITETKHTQEALAQFANDLEQSNKELEDFAYIASHDLKEPLRGIRNYSNFLLEDYQDRLEEDGRDKLQTLVKLAARLEHFIAALLQYSQVGRTEISQAPVAIGQQVHEIVDSLQGWLEEQDGAVTVRDPLPDLPCHPVLAAEVFRNLITNGIKYNDRDDKQVEVGVHAIEQGETVFFVRDNGIGIPEKHHETIFRIFRRLHGRDNYGGGTGAGLTISHKIVERHGGRIWLNSEPGAGTTFYFTLGKEIGAS